MNVDRLFTLSYPKGEEFWMGYLGVLNEEVLRVRRPEVHKLSSEEAERYSSIWASFAGPDLQKLLAILSNKKASNLTNDALPYLHRRLPSRLNGLNEIDHELLKHIIASAPSALSAVALAMGHDETPDMVGDLYLFARLKHFGS